MRHSIRSTKNCQMAAVLPQKSQRHKATPTSLEHTPFPSRSYTLWQCQDLISGYKPERQVQQQRYSLRSLFLRFFCWQFHLAMISPPDSDANKPSLESVSSRGETFRINGAKPTLPMSQSQLFSCSGAGGMGTCPLMTGFFHKGTALRWGVLSFLAVGINCLHILQILSFI